MIDLLALQEAGNLPPDLRTVEAIAAAAVRRAFLGRAWLHVFLQATRYPNPETLIARLAGETPIAAPASATLPTGTVTFLFTDIVGSTRLWETHSGAMQRALVRHDAILRQAIAEHSGHVFKTVGDAFCAAFATAPAAVDAAIVIQRVILSEPWAACGLNTPLEVRTVLHTGAADERDGDYFGPPLNRVARLCAVGHGGQILLSLAAQDLARDHLPPMIELRDLGEQRMKDLARPERIFQLVASDLSADFPPLRSLNAYRHNLPAQPTALIGREREVEDLTELVQMPELRLLTLTGPGGTGKTRLALQAAGELVERFADGVWFVGLAAISDPTLVASAIAGVLGLREQGDRPIAELLRGYLREKSLLLLLDNFEQVLPASGLVADLMAAAPQLKILVTSRVVLRLYGEREYVVPPLSLPERMPPPTFERVTQYEAVRLFIERARAVRSDFTVTAANAPLIAEICHRLDGLPLAIELAAARSKLFAPQAILSRLDKRLMVLTGGAQNLPARQQTLRGAIDWSYDLLDAAERESFARLGVFVGGCTLEAAAVVRVPQPRDTPLAEGQRRRASPWSDPAPGGRCAQQRVAAEGLNQGAFLMVRQTAPR
jgi:predicted ATPase/class 3 adenylate cyclase